MSDFDYTQLDPGIRCVVRLLHRWGYETSDSGDGKTKQASGEYDDRDLMAVPHVVIVGRRPWVRLKGANLMTPDDARMLMWELKQESIPTTPQGQYGATIQLNYCPAEHGSIIMLMDLSDADLPDDLRVELEAEIAPSKEAIKETFEAVRERRKGALERLAEAAGNAFSDVGAVAFVDELRGKDREGGDE